MAKKLTPAEIEKRFEEINALEAEEPSAEDLAAIAAAEAEDPAEKIALAEFKAEREYSGNLMIRIPKDLHRELVAAAKANGVSLNQYALYKLAK